MEWFSDQEHILYFCYFKCELVAFSSECLSSRRQGFFVCLMRYFYRDLGIPKHGASLFHNGPPSWGDIPDIREIWMGTHGAWATTAAPQVRRSCFAGPVVLRPVAQHVNPALPLVDPKFPDILLVDRLSPGTWLLLECSAS